MDTDYDRIFARARSAVTLEHMVRRRADELGVYYDLSLRSYKVYAKEHSNARARQLFAAAAEREQALQMQQEMQTWVLN